jgi:CRP-like cAMP-binding protein
MGAVDFKSFLVATPFFGGLLDSSLDAVIGMLVERRYDQGVAVFHERDEGRAMYVVYSGELVVCKKGDSGRVVRISRLGPGDFFGEMTLIEMQNRSASVIAETPAVLYELGAASLYDLYQTDVHAYAMVLQNMNRELCRRLRRADQLITEFADAEREAVT